MQQSVKTTPQPLDALQFIHNTDPALAKSSAGFSSLKHNTRHNTA